MPTVIAHRNETRRIKLIYHREKIIRKTKEVCGTNIEGIEKYQRKKM